MDSPWAARNGVKIRSEKPVPIGAAPGMLRDNLRRVRASLELQTPDERSHVISRFPVALTQGRAGERPLRRRSPR